jgi:hypothetical protein
MIIYHGSYMPILKPEIRKARFSKDFGTGFYCTEILEQAKRWARRFETPITSHYEYKEAHDLDVLSFPEMTEEWIDFIVACRRGGEHSHDIVMGAMANDQIFNYVDDFIAGILTREQFWVLAKFKHPTHQIAFCTERALNTITYLKSEEVQP